MREKTGRMKKTVSGIIIIILMFSVFQTVIYASKPLDNETRRLQLEEKYYIYIAIPERFNETEESIYLTALEQGLRNLTPNMVQQVSAYYESLRGERISIYFEPYIPFFGIVGLFDYQAGEITLFTMQGMDSEEIEANFLHEFGHAFHYFCMDKLGKDLVLGDWDLLNQGNQYISWTYEEDNIEDVFPSEYGRTDVYEDFAEVFMYVFDNDEIIWKQNGERNRPFYDSNGTILYTKVNYIGSLVQKTIVSPEISMVGYYKDLGDRTSARANNLGTPGDYQYGDFTLQNWCVGYDSIVDDFNSEYGVTITEYADGREPVGSIAVLAKSYREQGKEVTWIPEYGLWRVTEQENKIRYIAPEYKSVDSLVITPNRTASGWTYNEVGWWYQKRDGAYIENDWFQDRDGKWYYFGADGYLLTNTTTPDGYQVDADGVCQ